MQFGRLHHGEGLRLEASGTAQKKYAHPTAANNMHKNATIVTAAMLVVVQPPLSRELFGVGRSGSEGLQPPSKNT
jgi:hypothetical protein